MQFSTKVRYAVRAMIELAVNHNSGPMQLKEIARYQEISEKYLEQIMSPLRTAGLILTKRGSHGGYYLKKDPGETTVSDIVCAIEGSLAPVACVDNPESCSRNASCVVRDVWSKVGSAVDKELKAITLKELAGEELANRSANKEINFEI